MLDRVAEIRRNGVDVFLDCLLTPPRRKLETAAGTRNRPKRVVHAVLVCQRERSKWVSWEWRTALKHRGLEGIEPHPLDPVEIASLPEELSDLHFGDPHYADPGRI